MAIPPTTETVTGDDWYSEDLSGRGEIRVAFVDVDLTESASTSGCSFEECTFRDSRFNLSIHAGAAFANCAFINCSFFAARFTECKFVGAMFDRCSFDQLTVVDGDWSFVGLAGADLRNASFTGVRIAVLPFGILATGALLQLVGRDEPSSRSPRCSWLWRVQLGEHRSSQRRGRRCAQTIPDTGARAT